MRVSKIEGNLYEVADTANHKKWWTVNLDSNDAPDVMSAAGREVSEHGKIGKEVIKAVRDYVASVTR